MKVFTSKLCGPCHALKQQLKENNIEVEYISIDTDEGVLEAISYGVSATPSLITEDDYYITGLKNILDFLNL